MSEFLRDPLLAEAAVEHGFGTRGAQAPEALIRPKQVHGACVVGAEACRAASSPPEADAIVCADAAVRIAIVTADCVPILLAAPGGGVVSAVHAGWRGLAAGVVAAGVLELAERAGCEPSTCIAAIGPHIGACCYEVDEPVLAELEAGLGDAARASASPGRPGHAQLDLAALSRAALLAAGLVPSRIGGAAIACTACDASRFHSYRRDGARSGRLIHYIRAAPQG